MLPSKYANVDVRELFPDFRPDKVLRFSRLFGPGKPTSLPQIWRSVRRRRRKRKQSREGRVCITTHTTKTICTSDNIFFHNIFFIQQKDGSDSTSETDESAERRNKGFLTLSYGSEPTPDMIAVDDEQLLLSAVSDDVHEKAQENSENGDSKPKVADWRYGPAQVWYDMLDVPDSGYVYSIVKLSACHYHTYLFEFTEKASITVSKLKMQKRKRSKKRLKSKANRFRMMLI